VLGIENCGMGAAGIDAAHLRSRVAGLGLRACGYPNECSGDANDSKMAKRKKGAKRETAN